jgi:hypothetical protein
MFASVPEGIHEVGLDMEQLPADYEPGAANQGRVNVEPRAVARTDLNVIRLTALFGKIVAPPGAPVENIVIRLSGTNRYTTPYQDGSFFFYNLREGDYEVTIDPQTVPEGYLLASPASTRASPRSFALPPRIVFELTMKPQAVKPVREILQQQIHIGGQNGTGQTGSGKAGQSGAGGSARGSPARGNRTGAGHAAHGSVGGTAARGAAGGAS